MMAPHLFSIQLFLIEALKTLNGEKVRGPLFSLAKKLE